MWTKTHQPRKHRHVCRKSTKREAISYTPINPCSARYNVGVMTQLTPRSLPSKAAVYAGVLCEQLPNLRRRYGVVSLGLFGSYVRGKQCEASDLDVLVQFDERPLSLLDLINLEHHLSDLLCVKVDLVEKKALKPQIRERILQEVVEW